MVLSDPLTGARMNAPVWEKIQQLFDEASELPAETRDAWLERACGEDRTLYLQVQSLLLANDANSGFPEREIAYFAERIQVPKPLDSIGPYRIVAELGCGGMGVVYLCERADGEFERKVAIKVLRAGLGAGPNLTQRFHVERRILASLDHPNIARMLDGGVTADGLPYLVMEYVEGVRIDQYCDRNHLSVRQRLQLFQQICSAVGYAHRNLIVHRDIKPSNILVGMDGVPKLLDFGIAKLSHPDEVTGEADITNLAERPMTPEYASPEQILGKGLSTTTDVYSLGIVLYELLSGNRPYDRTKMDPISLLRRICEQVPQRPSDAGSKPNLRGDLDHIMMMAIRKESISRYQSVELFSEDIDRYLDGYPVIARRGNRRYRISKFLQRHWLPCAATFTFLALIFASAANIAIQNARVIRERDIAQRERALSQKVSEFLNSLFQASDPFLNDGKQLSARQLLDSGADRLTKELKSEPEVRAELLETVGQAYKHIGELEAAERMFREKVLAVDQAYGPGSIPSIRILRQLGDMERMRKRPLEAERDLRRALALADQLPPGKDYELAQTLNNLALVETARGDTTQAAEHARRAVAIIARYPDDPREVLTMQSNLGSILFANGYPSKAEPILRKVLQQRRVLLGENHPQVPTSMRRLATVLANLGRYTEAEQMFRDARMKSAKLLRPNHPDILLCRYYLAEVLAAEGRYPEAEALTPKQKASDEDIPIRGIEAAVPAGIAGWTLYLDGKTPEAAPYVEEALTKVRAEGGPGTLAEARVLSKRSYVQASQGRFHDAAQSVAGALAIFDKQPHRGADAGDAFAAAAWMSRLRGETEQARVLFNRAVAADRSMPEPNQLALASHLVVQADFLTGLKDYAAAQSLAREALEIRTHVLPAGSWAIDLSRIVLAQAARDPASAQKEFATLRRNLGDSALLTRAASQRVSKSRITLPLF